MLALSAFGGVELEPFASRTSALTRREEALRQLGHQTVLRCKFNGHCAFPLFSFLGLRSPQQPQIGVEIELVASRLKSAERSRFIQTRPDACKMVCAEDIARMIFKFLAEVVISGRQIVGLVLNADQGARMSSIATTL